MNKKNLRLPEDVEVTYEGDNMAISWEKYYKITPIECEELEPEAKHLYFEDMSSKESERRSEINEYHNDPEHDLSRVNEESSEEIEKIPRNYENDKAAESLILRPIDDSNKSSEESILSPFTNESKPESERKNKKKNQETVLEGQKGKGSEISEIHEENLKK